MPRRKYIGDSETSHDLAADNVIANKPTLDHVVPSWNPSRGRHTSLTPELVERVAALVAGGVTIPVACTATGIKKSQWANWNRIGVEHSDAGYASGFGEGESPYAAWAEALSEAKAAFECNMTLLISSGHPQWKAARDILDARIPSRWAMKQQMKLDIKTDAEKARELSTEELEIAVRAALAEENK